MMDCSENSLRPIRWRSKRKAANQGGFILWVHVVRKRSGLCSGSSYSRLQHNQDFRAAMDHFPNHISRRHQIGRAYTFRKQGKPFSHNQDQSWPYSFFVMVYYSITAQSKQSPLFALICPSDGLKPSERDSIKEAYRNARMCHSAHDRGISIQMNRHRARKALEEALETFPGSCAPAVLQQIGSRRPGQRTNRRFRRSLTRAHAREAALASGYPANFKKSGRIEAAEAASSAATSGYPCKLERV